MGNYSRTLKFAVSTALAVTPLAACDKGGDEKHVNPGPVSDGDEPEEKHVNEGPVEEPVEHVNEGPVEEPTADTKGPDAPPEIDGTVNVAPVPEPTEKPTPKRTNTARVDPPTAK
jgi:hypothetical protein